MLSKFTKTAIALAVGAGCIGSAQALTPTSITSDNQILFFSGATATDGALESAMRLSTGGLCQANTVGIFRFGGTEAAQGNHRTIICSANGFNGGAAIAVTKESASGSGNAFAPVNGNRNIAFHDVRNLVCAGADNNVNTAPANDGNFGGTGGNVPNTTALTATTVLSAAQVYYNCTTLTAPRRSQGGISDVEARLFNEVGQNEVPVQQIMFGVPVSLNLYRALQESQGLLAGPCAAAPDAFATPQCVPSLSSDVIAALYNGLVTDWSVLSNVAGTPLTTSASNPPAENAVYICRRGDTSGTQRGTRAHFLNQGCGGADVFASASNATCTNSSVANPVAESDGCNFPVPPSNNPTQAIVENTQVFANGSSGNVRDCLDERDDQDRWAIGVLSTENTVNDIGGAGGDVRDQLGTNGAETHTREFRFVRIDGALPSLEIMAMGGYDFYTENVCTRASNVTLASLQGQMIQRLCGDAQNGISAGLANPAVLAAINDGFDDQPHGDGGLLAKPDYVAATPNGIPVTRTQIGLNPVNITTRSATGTVNNCSNPLALPIPELTVAPAAAPNN